MAVRQNAAPVGAGDHRHAGVCQLAHRVAAGQGAATQPQQRTLSLFQPLMQPFHRRIVRLRQRRRRQRFGQHRTGNQAALNIDRDLDRHRAARHGLRIQDRPLDHRHRLLRRIDPVSALGAGAQEAELIAGFMNKTGVGVQIGFLHLAGDMQQRRVGVERLNHRPHRVAGAGAGAGQRYAQARETPVRVGHGDRPRFAARRHEANFIALPHRIGDRQIMNRNDAVHRRHRILFQSPGYRLANRDFIAHHLPS